ncbi:lipid A-modifier LpxR family protein [Cellulophaga baltica]|uniref:lipid A-modifier LpxR family protein n=1 Tax=Cellulophaga baltica TaxID=76594 RepID=UPI0031E54CEB
MNFTITNFRVLCVFFLFWNIVCLGQKPNKFNSEISFSSANDAYVIWQNSDRFYSYGVGLNLKFKKDKLFGLQKYFLKKEDYFFDIGLRIEGYTPTNKVITPIEILSDNISFDRPYAGLLFTTFNVTYAFNRSFFKGGTILGIMGPSSLAGDFQGWFHNKETDDPVFEEWKYQLPNQPVVNLNFTYAYDFIPEQKWIDIYGVLDARLGNLYIDSTPTLGLRFGKFNKLSQSVGTDTSLLSNSSNIELFFQSTISSSVSFFNGTAQGSLFQRNFEYAVDSLNMLHTVITLNTYFSANRFSFGIEHYFTFGQVLSNERHVYARVIFKYKL